MNEWLQGLTDSQLDSLRSIVDKEIERRNEMVENNELTLFEKNLVDKKQYVDAIRAVRVRLNWSLVESKRLVDKYKAGL